MIDYTSAIAQAQWRWPHVDPLKEWADHVSGRILVEPSFLDRFETLRELYGKPLPILSGYRTPEHNQQVSTTGENGPHTHARACDVRVHGADALRVIELALVCGFTGIGVQQKGPMASRYLHLDDLMAPDFPRPGIWSY